jgi:hypothetical protein
MLSNSSLAWIGIVTRIFALLTRTSKYSVSGRGKRLRKISEAHLLGIWYVRHSTWSYVAVIVMGLEADRYGIGAVGMPLSGNLELELGGAQNEQVSGIVVLRSTVGSL